MSNFSSIDSLRSSISKYTDFAKNSRFRVTISVKGEELLKFRCLEATLPGRSFATFETRTYGLFQKFPSQTNYDDFSLTFICSGNEQGSKDTGLPEKRIFEDWMDNINPTENPATRSQFVPLYNFRYKNEYAKEIVVDHFDVDEKRTYSVRFMDAFPIQLNPVNLGWANEDNMLITVTFSYSRWQRETLPQNNIQPYPSTGRSTITDALSTQQAPSSRRAQSGLAVKPSSADSTRHGSDPQIRLVDPNDTSQR